MEALGSMYAYIVVMWAGIFGLCTYHILHEKADLVFDCIRVPFCGVDQFTNLVKS